MRNPRSAFVAVLALVSVTSAWGQPQPELVLHFVEIGQRQKTIIPHVMRLKLIIVSLERTL